MTKEVSKELEFLKRVTNQRICETTDKRVGPIVHCKVSSIISFFLKEPLKVFDKLICEVAVKE